VADDIGAGQWRRITATVKPIKKQPKAASAVTAHFEPMIATISSPPKRGRLPAPLVPKSTPRIVAPVGSAPIDKAWERDLRSGKLSPDKIIDLHGHHLAGAHTALARALDRAVAGGERLLLVVAGKARGSDEAPRGAIRRELTAWLVHSPHARRILAVRNAHPRHGGAGAVYVVLRKSA
jgi:DNA-nicking Smr family endonuclease